MAPRRPAKGTVAKGIAARLGFEMLDTGAMYRAVALAAIRRRRRLRRLDRRDGDSPGLDHRNAAWPSEFSTSEDVSTAIREPAVSQCAARSRRFPPSAHFLIPQQRRIAEGRDIVCEGRDQGTIVFPDAPVKFYITANVRTPR